MYFQSHACGCVVVSGFSAGHSVPMPSHSLPGNYRHGADRSRGCVSIAFCHAPIDNTASERVIWLSLVTSSAQRCSATRFQAKGTQGEAEQETTSLRRQLCFFWPGHQSLVWVRSAISAAETLPRIQSNVTGAPARPPGPVDPARADLCGNWTLPRHPARFASSA